MPNSLFLQKILTSSFAHSITILYTLKTLSSYQDSHASHDLKIVNKKANNSLFSVLPTPFCCAGEDSMCHPYLTNAFTLSLTGISCLDFQNCVDQFTLPIHTSNVESLQTFILFDQFSIVLLCSHCFAS